jgi:1,2-diacylglycerol 3-beta-glucosyltransferase
MLTQKNGRYTILPLQRNQDGISLRTAIAMKDKCYSIYPVERISLSVLIYSVVALALFLPQIGQWISWWQIVLAFGTFFVTMRHRALRHNTRACSRCSAGACAVHETPLGKTRPEEHPTISIIVAAHNEEAVIENLVRNLSIVDYPNVEILIVDDRSTDRTPEILRNLTSDFNFKHYSRPHGSRSGKSAVLNEALSKTAGEFIAVFDADARINPNFLRKMVTYISSPQVGAVQGRKCNLNGRQNLLTTCQTMELAMDAYIQSQRDTIIGAVELRGNGMLIRRSALESLGGFSEDNISEDLELCTRMHAAGWDLRYAPDAKVFEEATPTLGALLRQRARWTEASLIRYLVHASAVFSSSKTALLAKTDLRLFCFECLVPFWLLLENILLGLRWATGTLPSHPVSFASALAVVLSGYFVIVSCKGIHKFVGGSVLQTAYNTFLLYSYLSLLFLPISLEVVFSILVRKERNLVWIKTQHFGSAQ